MVMIATAVGVAAKWFGSKRGDSDDDVQGNDPIVRAMFKAVNLGDLDDLDDLVDESCKVYINSGETARNDDALDQGPKLWNDAIGDLRQAFPNVHWELYDELTGKDEGKHKIAIRFVSNTKVDEGGSEDQFEVAGFGIVENNKLTEWHQVADMDAYNRRRSATGENALGQ